MSVALLGRRPSRSLSDGLRIGLRGRVTLAVALVGLLLSVVLSLTTVTVARSTLLETREEAIALQATENAEILRPGLETAEATDLQTLLSSLPDSGDPLLVVDAGDQPGESDLATVSVDARYSLEDLPASLRERVIDDRETAIMRFDVDGLPVVAVGVPLDEADAAYFEVNPVEDIDTAIRTLSVVLVVVAGLATILAMALGFWASRYALQPLRRIGGAAESVALGDLDTRLDYEDYSADVDLAPLVANFNDMVSALQARIDRDARFTSDVSHELRSPLTTLNASIDVLMNNRDALPERSQQALDLLDLDMRRFTQLVEDLLEISRFDAGAVRLELDNVALVPAVTAAVRTLATRPIPVDSDPRLDDVVVACDKRRLMRILANFLNNAEKYADGATGVFVELHEPAPDDATARPTVRIAVEDAGPGVPDAQRERVFDRFNRGDQGGSRGTDLGVGLGLALAAEHARLQGGSVWVEDRHDGGQGSRFVMELPLADLGGDDHHDDADDLAAVSREEADEFAATGQLPVVSIDPGETTR